LSTIENRIGIKFERIGVPLPDDRLSSQAMQMVESLKKLNVEEELLQKFIPAAESLVNVNGAVDAVCRCLCEISGYSKEKFGGVRSVLTGKSGSKAFQIVYHKTQIRSLGYVWKTLKGTFPGKEDKVEKISSMTMLGDFTGAVFDVSSEILDDFEIGVKNFENKQKDYFVISPLRNLPELATTNNNNSINTQGDNQQIISNGKNPNHRWNSGKSRGTGNTENRRSGSYSSNGNKNSFGSSRNFNRTNNNNTSQRGGNNNRFKRSSFE